MIRLRPYKPGDAFRLLEWWKDADKETFKKWSLGKFSYPLTMEELDSYFSKWCLQEENGWLMTALNDEGTPVGHFNMRLADYEKETVRMGFIVVAPDTRGKHFGRQMMEQALEYAFHVLGMKTVTLGVFENNPGARACYKAAGFRETAYIPEYFQDEDGVYGGYEMEAVHHG